MRVAIADDSMLFREGLVRLLEELEFAVVAQTSTGEDLLEMLGDVQPDVALLDIRMPPTYSSEGIAAAATLGERYPDMGVVLLSHHLEPDYALRLLSERSSGRGYLLKDSVGDLATFSQALRRVGAGGTFLDPAVVAAMVEPPGRPSRLDVLSAREREVLTLMAEGLSNAGICDRLVLSPRTVETHIRAIFTKLDITETDDQNRRVVAVLTLLREA